MATQTPRVKYELDAAGQIGVQHANWDRADEVAGIIYTTKAAGIPPVAKLYDGCVVSEKDTGISYRLFASETFAVKHYVNYPFCVRMHDLTDVFNGPVVKWGWRYPDLANCVNYDSTWSRAGDNAFAPQIKGLYKVRYHTWWQEAWGTYPWTDGNIAMAHYNNDAVDMEKIATQNIASNFANSVATLDQMFTQKWGPGDFINAFLYNSGAAAVRRVTMHLEVAMIRPLD